MSNNYKKALFFHFQNKSDAALLFHSNHVSYIANQIYEQLKNSNPTLKFDQELVSVGALLHDIGRTKTHDINHGIVGGEMIRTQFSNEVARIAETHIGGGIPKEESIILGLPAKDYVPVTLEEKIVCFADKLVDYDFIKDENNNYLIKKSYTFNNIENEVKKLGNTLGTTHPVIQRLINLEKELHHLNNGFIFHLN